MKRRVQVWWEDLFLSDVIWPYIVGGLLVAGSFVYGLNYLISNGLNSIHNPDIRSAVTLLVTVQLIIAVFCRCQCKR